MATLILPESGLLKPSPFGRQNLNWRSSLVDGLVGAWLMDGRDAGSNLLWDASVFSNNGTLVNMDATDWTVAGGRLCLDYTTASDQNVLLSRPVGLTLPLTIFAWFNTAQTSGVQTIFSTQIDPSNANMMRMILYQSKVQAQHQSAGTQRIIGSTTTYSTNVWNSACAIFASGTDRMAYLNAGGKNNSTLSAPTFTPTASRIGKVVDTGFPEQMNGKIGLVAVWNRVLSDNEIFNLHTSTLDGSAGILARSTRWLPVATTGGATPGTYTASSAITTGGTETSATASHTAPTFTASADITIGGVESAATATFDAGTKTATAGITVGGAEIAATASHTAPTYTASVDVTIGGVETSATATFAVNTFTATSAIPTGGTEASATASHTAPTFTASVDATIGGVEASATAAYASAIRTATAAITTGGLEAAITAAFSPGTKTATAAITIGGVECDGTASVQNIFGEMFGVWTPAARPRIWTPAARSRVWTPQARGN